MIDSSAPRIHKLSTVLANQIAAGEVVERPASVVKELLENSLDAGAGDISIELEQGGVKLIRVRDDGCGIHEQDLALALSRHATSKVETLADLEAVRSLGFRGEALPSIASIARLEIRSRMSGMETGWRVVAEGAEPPTRPEPSAQPLGTVVNVSDLFFNTPARRKFLRTERTEYRHVEDVVRRIALSRFEITFGFAHNGKRVWSLRAAETDTERLSRIEKLCGAAFCEQALGIEFEAAGLRLSGWLGLPAAGRSQSNLQYFFVNGRMVRDRVVGHAIRQAYEDDLPRGTHPAFVLYLEIDPARVDVNVHPAKHEVQFHESRLVHDFLFRTLKRSLGEHQAPRLGLEAATSVEPRASESGLQSPLRGDEVREQLAAYRGFHSRLQQPQPVAAEGPLGRPIGQLHGRYLVAENGDRLVLVDLAAARARLVHARLKAAAACDALRTRPLLVPARLDLKESDAELIERNLGVLERTGLEFRRTGPSTISLRGLPASIEHADPVSLVEAICALLSSRSSADDSVLAEELFVLLAKHAASQASQPGEMADMSALLRGLESHCLDAAGGIDDRAWIELGVDDIGHLMKQGR